MTMRNSYVGWLLGQYVKQGETRHLRDFATTLRRQEGLKYDDIIRLMKSEHPTLTEEQYDTVVLGKKRSAA